MFSKVWISLFIFGNILAQLGFTEGSPSLSFSAAAKVKVGEATKFTATWGDIGEDTLVWAFGDWLQINADGEDYGKLVLEPRHFNLTEGSGSLTINISTSRAGKFDISFNTSSTNATLYGLVRSKSVEVEVVHSLTLAIINIIIGWIYFAAWSVSFYPQVFVNWKRKSVIGLNFDFLSYNLMGFTMYGLFNIGLFWIPEIQHQFHVVNPHSVIPVQANDVAFTIHAVAVTAFTVSQCFMYDRGDQRVSYVARFLVGASCLMMLVMLFVTIAHKYSWLNYLYLFSYIKLGVTLIKYVPQAFMNYRRKSTVGWSIGNVLLDLTGGSLSMLQMLLMGYNYDDFKTVFQDLTKFGLGMFSVLFDILFIIQHYILYRPYKRYESLPSVNHTESSSSLDH